MPWLCRSGIFAYVVVLARSLRAGGTNIRQWRNQRQPARAFGADYDAAAYCQLVLGATCDTPNHCVQELFRIAVYFHIGMALVLAGHGLALARRTVKLSGTLPSAQAASVLRRPP